MFKHTLKQYDLIKMEEMEQQATMEAASKSAANNDPRKAADFIDFTMPPPKKITLPKVEIQKPDGPLPFQVITSIDMNVNAESKSSQVNIRLIYWL